MHPTTDHYTLFFHTFPQVKVTFLSFRLQNITLYDIFFAEDAPTTNTLPPKLSLMKKGHRMTIARQRKPQPIVNSSERENFFSVVPTTSDIIILGENATASEQEVQKKGTKELLTDATMGAFRGLDGWLAFRVRKELVTQIYSSIENEETNIDVDSVRVALNEELTAEKQKNISQASHLEDILPIAAKKEKSVKPGDDYSVKDIDNLQMRLRVHHEVVALIDAIESTGDEGTYHLAESYIQQTRLDAHNEVLSIYSQRKAELEDQNKKLRMRNASNEAKITELEGIIASLKNEIEYTNGQLEERNEQIEDRDVQLLDNELVNHLTKEAQDLAR